MFEMTILLARGWGRAENEIAGASVMRMRG
jgi:hypothetical protein